MMMMPADIYQSRIEIMLLQPSVLAGCALLDSCLCEWKLQTVVEVAYQYVECDR